MLEKIFVKYLFNNWNKKIIILAYLATSRESTNNVGEVSKPMVKLLKINSSYLDIKNQECHFVKNLD